MEARTINLDTDLGPDPTTGTTDTPGSDTGPATAPPRTAEMNKLENQLQDFQAQLGTYIAMMAPDPFAGTVIALNAEPTASALTDLAAQDPRVKAALKKFLTGGVWANLAGIIGAGTLLPILAYYGKVPDKVQGMILMGAAQSNPMLAAMIQARHGDPSGG